MSLAGARGMLFGAQEELHHEWARVRTTWDDRNAEAFEVQYLQPLDQRIRQAVDAMEQLSSLIQQAHRACG